MAPSNDHFPLLNALRYPFLVRGRVSRLRYLAVGVGLMLFKYLVEALMIQHFTGNAYGPTTFFDPRIASRAEAMEGGPKWLGFAWLCWTMPFLWIAVCMSLRRALDAKLTPWLSLWILVPVFNVMVMLVLIFSPVSDYQEDTEGDPEPRPPSKFPNQLQSSLIGIGGGIAIFLFGASVSIYGAGNYGIGLFLGTPVLSGVIAGVRLNRHSTHSVATTTGTAFLMLMLVCVAMLALALEGAICVAMAVPLLLPLIWLGLMIGRAMAASSSSASQGIDKGMACTLLVFPVLLALEPDSSAAPLREVQSEILIDAPIEEVWQAVVAFPEIDAPIPWYFRAGIAMPMRARIEGQGVGAIRYCDFTTGSFVEPITVWDAPHRLAFDVTEQPDPMVELSPYGALHPPHLQSAFRSERGEFRLISQADGKTLLQGSTWYSVGMSPQAYWTPWTDGIVHAIHLRVLRHIRSVVQAGIDPASLDVR